MKALIYTGHPAWKESLNPIIKSRWEQHINEIPEIESFRLYSVYHQSQKDIESQLKDEEIKQGTFIFTMKESHRQRVINDYAGANETNTFVLSSFVGEELEIMDPYGGNLQVYGICLEALGSTLEELPEKLKEL